MTKQGVFHEYRATLPTEQRSALKKAVKWQVFTICYTIGTIVLVAFVLGNSQAMKTAWIEDMLSLIPQLTFLIALLFIRRKPTVKHPYGLPRAMGVGHLVAGVALLAVGLNLGFDSAVGLIAGEHPTIGTVRMFGETVWVGWIMILVMAVIVIGPFIYGRAKQKLAPKLHNKLLHADADMAKADWQTNAATIVGVFGVGMGLWWLDGAAALFISIGIVLDGYRNTKTALSDLVDQRARSTDDSTPHPLASEILAYVHRQWWVAEAAIRMRDQGQVMHVEVFVRPRRSRVSLERVRELCAGIEGLDWKIQDVVVMPTAELPEHADRTGTESKRDA